MTRSVAQDRSVRLCMLWSLTGQGSARDRTAWHRAHEFAFRGRWSPFWPTGCSGQVDADHLRLSTAPADHKIDPDRVILEVREYETPVQQAVFLPEDLVE